jgi:flagellar hook assembly protein FlgD
VELTVYNIQGRLIRTLTEGSRPAGEYEAAWDGTDEYGIDVAAGVYLYRLRLGELEETRKMILVR